MASRKPQKPPIEGVYRPTVETRARVQKWIDHRDWFMNRRGRQRELLLAIAKDCGYTRLPKLEASMKALIGEHIVHFFSRELAGRFNQMVDELEKDTKTSPVLPSFGLYRTATGFRRFTRELSEL